MKKFLLNPMDGTSYQIHQKLKQFFNGDKFIFQVTPNGIVVISDTIPSCHYVTLPMREIEVEDEVGFTLRVNPVVKKKGKRVPVGRFYLGRWLKSRLSKYGAEVVDVVCSLEPTIYFNKSNTNDKVTLCSAFVEGVVRVKDADLFKSLIYNGLGHGKGFGFGLVNVY